jgi:hypothetical protein
MIFNDVREPSDRKHTVKPNQSIRCNKHLDNSLLQLTERQDTSDVYRQGKIHTRAVFEVQVLTNIMEELDIDPVHPIALTEASDPSIVS